MSKPGVIHVGVQSPPCDPVMSTRREKWRGPPRPLQALPAVTTPSSLGPRRESTRGLCYPCHLVIPNSASEPVTRAEVHFSQGPGDISLECDLECDARGLSCAHVVEGAGCCVPRCLGSCEPVRQPACVSLPSRRTGPREGERNRTHLEGASRGQGLVFAAAVLPAVGWK